jgi:hypothetical protein
MPWPRGTSAWSLPFGDATSFGGDLEFETALYDALRS